MINLILKHPFISDYLDIEISHYIPTPICIGRFMQNDNTTSFPWKDMSDNLMRKQI